MGYPIDFEQSWQKKLGNALDRTAGQATRHLILDGGETPGGAGSTVLDVTAEPPLILREGMVLREHLEGFFSGVPSAGTGRAGCRGNQISSRSSDG